MKNLILFLFFIGCYFHGVAQITNAITWKNSLSNENPKVGEEITLIMEAKIKKGYHIYSSKRSAKDSYMPTELILDKVSKGVQVVGKLEEIGQLHKQYDEVFEDDLFFYEDKVIFKQKLKILSKKVLIRGVLKYQICDTTQCVPGDNEIKFQIKALAEGNSVKSDTSEQKADNQQNNDQDTIQPVQNTDKKNANLLEEKKNSENSPVRVKELGVFTIFLEAFLFGLISLLTPCVFPMIPMTVSFFTDKKKKGNDHLSEQEKKRKKAKGIKNALIFSGAIIFIYTFMGLLITVIFGPQTLYKLSSDPWVNLFFFVMVFLFGLSFLGWFEITLPSSWVNAVDKKSNVKRITFAGDSEIFRVGELVDIAQIAEENRKLKKEGKQLVQYEENLSLTGIFFMALTLALVSFSCTGPIIGTLLVNAASGEVAGPLVGMLGFSLAFALPFGLFAMFPSWLDSLPKSGGWLNTVKVVLGFLEIALALKFLSNADLVWHLGILDRDIYLSAWIVIFTMLGFYLLGFILLPHDDKVEKLSVPRLMLAILTFWFVLYMIPGMWGADLKLLSGFLPPIHDNIGVRILDGTVIGALKNATENEICQLSRKYEHLKKDTPPGFCTFYDLEEAQQYAKKVNKPLFIDFTGHTCVNCRDMEQNVWTDKRVKKLLNQHFVMVSLFVDDREPLEQPIEVGGKTLRYIGDQWLYFQQTKYHTNAQPYYVITDPDLNNLVEPRAYNKDVEAYVKFLEDGLNNFKKL